VKKFSSLLRRFDGPLTRELVRTPGKFGLGQIPEKHAPDAVTTLVCGYCSTGCGLRAHLKNGEAVNLSADPRYPVNLGMACPKGWEALAPVHAPDRALTPLLRRDKHLREIADGPEAGKDADVQRPVEWDEALAAFVTRFKSVIERHGPESVAFLSTGQIPTEEMFVLGSLFKFGMGGIHSDANTRQCMATAHVAYKQAFGFDAPPFAYRDFEESDVLVFVGANPCIAHPILWERVMMNKKNPEILVVDPRLTETAQAATRHYALAPKSDLAFFYAIAHVLIREDWIDRDFVDAHVSGYVDFALHVADYSPKTVAATCGISAAAIEEFARLIHAGKAVSFWWTMGVNQSHEAVRTAQALINLALITGNIGRPGTGANSITGQMNAMGSRIFSNTTSLAGGRDFLNADHRREVADALGIDPARIPAQNSLAYDQIVEGVCAGRIKALWVIATNPLHSWPDGARLREGMRNLECLAVQDMYADTDTAKMADVFLPAAGWGEKEGTLINSERRLGLFKKIARAPGKALADFHIFRLIAEYWGCADLFRDMKTPEQAFQVMKRISAGRPCDFSGIRDYAHIDARGGIQWPCRPGNTGDEAQERRLFGDGKFFTPDGKARMLFEAVRPPAEKPDAAYPFTLLTGRGTSAQWHTNTRTGRSAVLRKLYPVDCYVELHAADAETLGIRAEQWIRVRTRRGALRARAFLAATVAPGQIFLPMHYEGVNALTLSEFDPHSRQPSYKHCAAMVERISGTE
jgi:anaerobic selenocysteine-containing dehydrogenase